MGKAEAVEKKTKKKKGRPSLLDLQKRSLKEQQDHHQPPQLKTKIHNIQNPSPPDSSTPPAGGFRRSTRRNPNPNPNPDPTTDDEDRSIGKRREKKLNLVLKLPDEDNSGTDSNPDDHHSSRSNPRKRKIGSIAHGSGQDTHDKDEKFGASANQTIDHQGSKLDDGPSTPLPDQKLLLFILDRLQKKDTYGVYADPVDPEELPDYHEVIEHPMDFSTIRKKLANGSYGSLEQFEKDVFLLCSNAMQYNSPDTIYFRQARSIQELAKKDFDNLRQDSDDNEPQPEPKVVRRGRPPTKNLKRPRGRPPLERANSDFSEATPPTTTGVNNNRSNSDTRKGTPLEKAGSADLFLQSFYGSRYGETYIGWSAERYEKADDMTGSASKGILMKHGKKQIILDENRRNTYKQSFALACSQEPSVLTTFNGERKQLIAVGLHTEYGYARSLSRFATKLGPVAWKVASKRMQRCLPSGVKFGPGWVGETEAPVERRIPHELPTSSGQPSKSSSSVNEAPSSPTPTQLAEVAVEPSSDKSAKPPQGEQSSGAHTSSIRPKSDDGGSSKGALSPGNDVGPSSNEASTSSNPNTTPNMSNSSSGAMKVVNRVHNHQSSNTQSRMNGLNGSYGLNFAVQMGKMIGSARPVTMSSPSTVNNGAGEAKLPENSGSLNLSECLLDTRGPHQKVGPTPPDLNVGFQTPGSPHSGRSDSVQPDLALQL